MTKFIFLFVLLFLSASVYSQQNKTNNKGNAEQENKQEGIGLISNRDTLNTYLKSWQLSRSNNIINFPVDTALSSSQIYDPKFTDSFPGAAYNTGNIGSPIFHSILQSIVPDISVLYERPLLESIFSFRPVFLYNNYSPYLLSIDNCSFFHTNKPFTHISYTMNTVKSIEEQTLHFTHSQNVNQNLNIGINYKMINSEGMYANQKTANNSFQLFSSFFNKKYNLHTSFGVNKIKNAENGGIVLSDNKELETTALPVYLDAKNTLSNINFSVIQRFNLGRKIEIKNTETLNDSTKVFAGDSLSNKKDSLSVLIDYNTFSSFIHRIDIDRTNKIYKDKTDSTTFYNNYYFPRRISSIDSSRYLMIINSVEWLLPTDAKRNLFPNSGLRLLGGHEFEKYHTLQNYIRINNNDFVFSNIYIGGNAFKQRGDFQIDLGSRLYLSGRKIGNMNLSGELKGNLKLKNDSALITISSQLNIENPSYFEENYSSTNFRWKNDFKELIELRMKSVLAVPKWKAFAGIEYATIDNYIYFNTEALPTQLSATITTMSIFGQKDFHLKNFHSSFKFVTQTYTNKDILHLPKILFYNSSYVILKTKVVDTHIGFDITYSSSFYAPAYSPALSTFYLQNEYKTRAYPVVDIFANFKIMNAILFFKYEHISSLLYDDKYVPVFQHPYNESSFKIGVKWKFLN